jgi:hypothetical protein
MEAEMGTLRTSRSDLQEQLADLTSRLQARRKTPSCAPAGELSMLLSWCLVFSPGTAL